MSRRKIRLERTFAAPLEDVWELWTSKEGIESWWGPEGFTVEVLALDLRPGGAFRYAMKATAPAQVEFMRNAGMPLTNDVRARFTEAVAGMESQLGRLAKLIEGRS